MDQAGYIAFNQNQYINFSYEYDKIYVLELYQKTGYNYIKKG